MANQSKQIAHDLHVYLRDQTHWKTIARWLVIGMVVLFLVVWFGKDMIAEIEIVEQWIEGHGVLGWAVFVVLVVVVASLFMPLSMMAVAGGAMFGILIGSVLTFVGAVLTAGFNYLGARSLLKTRIESMLENHPKLRAIQQAVHRQGLKLQLLLRMAPINATSVNYVLGATGVRFSTYMIATVALLPSIAVNAYVGHTATHVTKAAGKSSDHSTVQTIATVVGLIICIAVMVVITRVATKAIADASNVESTDE